MALKAGTASAPPRALGRFVMKSRSDLGLTQEQVSEIAEISVRALRNIELGLVTRPRRYTIEALTVALALDDEQRNRLWCLANESRLSAARHSNGQPRRGPEAMASDCTDTPGGGSDSGEDDHYRLVWAWEGNVASFRDYEPRGGHMAARRNMMAHARMAIDLGGATDVDFALTDALLELGLDKNEIPPTLARQLILLGELLLNGSRVNPTSAA